jgi:hypothetical protein
MTKTFNYDFEELPLIIENGFEACDVTGTAEISYNRHGEWGIESISFEGAKRNHWTIADYAAAVESGDRLSPYTRKPVALDATTPLHGIIYHRLENEWRDRVQDAVNEQIEADRDGEAEFRAELRREDRMMERLR